MHMYSLQSNIRVPGGGFADRAPRKTATDPANSCYVGNLDFSVTSEDILSFCEEILGPGLAKDVRLAIDRETGIFLT